jgi:hypothetical protein
MFTECSLNVQELEAEYSALQAANQSYEAEVASLAGDLAAAKKQKEERTKEAKAQAEAARKEGQVALSEARREGQVALSEARREGQVALSEARREGQVALAEATRKGEEAVEEEKGKAERAVSASIFCFRFSLFAFVSVFLLSFRVFSFWRRL